MPAARLALWLAQHDFPGPAARGAQGCTPLMHAAGRGEAPVLAALLANGASVDAEDDEGNTALWHACRCGAPACIAQLAAAGADLDHANDAGWTCLMLAAARRRGDVTAQLLALGASTTPCAPDGRRAPDLLPLAA